MDRKIIKALLKGIITYLPFSKKFLRKHKEKSMHSGSFALFCYSFWLRTINLLDKNNISHSDLSIAELGSGGSFGIGMCALLTGCKSYLVLDIEDRFDLNLNLQLLDSIVQYFNSALPIPDNNEFSKINLRINDYSFPTHLIKKAEYKNGEFINLIKNDLFKISEHKYSQCQLIHYYSNWLKQQIDRKCDLIMSRAVMEHVSNPEIIYEKSNKLINKNGLHLHDIEFHSHNISKFWDGHLPIPNLLWEVIKGRREYYLNRWDYGHHIEYAKTVGLDLIDSSIVKREPNYSNDGIYGAAVLFQNNFKN
jgi:hypothetical protein